MSLFRSVATVGGLTLVSRVFGFVRDILIAAALGAGPVADAFFVAFKLPNVFRGLFAEGAFNAAFIPFYARRLAGEGHEAAIRLAEQVLAALLFILFVVLVLAEIAMPWVVAVMAPGFDGAIEALAVELMRLTFPYLLFVSMATLFSATLNASGRFAAAAGTPILLNIAMIGALLGLGKILETPAHALAWGVTVAGGLQFSWLALSCHNAGLRLRLTVPRPSKDVRRLLGLMMPVALGAGATQIGVVVNVMLASLLPTGSISFLYYADRVNQLPLGVVGIAVGTALLPLLSRQLRNGEIDAAANSQNRAIEIALVLALPAAAALIMLAGPIMSTLFQRGAFGADAAAATAAALAAYACGLPAYVLIRALTPGFFARENTATPVKIGILCLTANVAISVALMTRFAYVGIAAATAASAWLNVVLLFMALRRRNHLVLDARLLRRLPRMALATAAMAGGLVIGLAVLAPLLAGSLPARAFGLALLVLGGVAIFAGAAQLAGAADWREVRRQLGRAPGPSDQAD